MDSFLSILFWAFVGLRNAVKQTTFQEGKKIAAISPF